MSSTFMYKKKDRIKVTMDQQIGDHIFSVYSKVQHTRLTYIKLMHCVNLKMCTYVLCVMNVATLA